MAFHQRKIGIVLGSIVPEEERGINNGYHNLNPPSNSLDRSLLYITGKYDDFIKIGEKPKIFKTGAEASSWKTGIDVVFKAQLNDTGDDILYLIE